VITRRDASVEMTRPWKSQIDPIVSRCATRRSAARSRRPVSDRPGAVPRRALLARPHGSWPGLPGRLHTHGFKPYARLQERGARVGARPAHPHNGVAGPDTGIDRRRAWRPRSAGSCGCRLPTCYARRGRPFRASLAAD
jgi:hypothetical protein